ncbi:MAG: protein-L-isoaspartate(D-aspartate) O-methyltransferase [Prolixibacteraceae bacterium]|nr:protein-L-isoaspartate(D-aspartate) O-methyltransferase [Prolixibacteraceae bacterium]
MKTTGFLILLYLFTINICAQTPDGNFKERRERMVSSQIETRGLEHTSTLKAMRSVPRHLFVPEKMRDYAYDNRPLPIGHGQTISQPYIVAFMTSTIQPKADYKVLEIGTGSGYQAAILSEIVDSVYTIEIVEPLYEQASERLADLGYDNVKVKYGDGYYGWEEHAPYDAIVVTAAAEYIPPPLLDQLKTGGKMIIPVGSPFMAQSLILVSKKKDKITTSKLMPVRFVPFTRNE